MSPKGSFICSIDAPGYPYQEVSQEIIEDWDDIWKEMSEEFDREIAGTCWADLIGKMLYVWDGNHRLFAWMVVSKQSRCSPLIVCYTPAYLY